MKKFAIFLILMCMTAAIAGCTKAPEPKPQNPPQNVGEEVVVPEPAPELKIINSSDISDEVLGWNEVSSYEGDIDGDDQMEVVRLVTSADYDRKAGFFWNDGQNWALLVEDGEERYELFRDYISSGSPYFEVSEYYTEDTAKTQIDLVVTSGASLVLKGYCYSETDNGFVERVMYDSGIESKDGLNKMHSSFPMYD